MVSTYTVVPVADLPLDSAPPLGMGALAVAGGQAVWRGTAVGPFQSGAFWRASITSSLFERRRFTWYLSILLCVVTCRDAATARGGGVAIRQTVPGHIHHGTWCGFGLVFRDDGV